MGKQRKVQLSEAEVAYQVLRQHKSPMHYRDLVVAIRERLGYDEANPGPSTAQIHTEINLDSRLSYLGNGMWGLASWAPRSQQIASGSEPSERSYQPKQADYIWDEDEEEEVESEDVEEAGFVPDGPDLEEEDEIDPDLPDDFLDDEELLIDEEKEEEPPTRRRG
jgi:DNA-directed RNA polymerase subunit delta